MKAFPHSWVNERGNQCHNFGMDLRDYFAATALQGMLSGRPAGDSASVKAWAETAYKMADAMMKAKEQK